MIEHILSIRKLVPKHIPYQDIYDYIYIHRPVYVPRIVVFILCIKCTTRWPKDVILSFNQRKRFNRIIYLLLIAKFGFIM